MRGYHQNAVIPFETFAEAQRKKRARELERVTEEVERRMEARMTRLQRALMAEGMPHEQALSLADRVSDAIEFEDPFWRDDIEAHLSEGNDEYQVSFLSERARQWAAQYLLPEDLQVVDGHPTLQTSNTTRLDALFAAFVWSSFRVKTILY